MKRSLPTLSRKKLRRALALATIVLVASQCGIVYTDAVPYFYLPCTGDASSCSCSAGSEPTRSPEVEYCSASVYAGLCCADADAHVCSCHAITCTDDGSSCVCALAGAATASGDQVATCPDHGTCCVDPAKGTCTCSAFMCDNGQSQVKSCGSSVFSCTLAFPGKHLVATDACSAGPLPRGASEACGIAGEDCSTSSDCCSLICLSSTHACL